MKSLNGAVAVLLVGCGGQTLDIGNDKAPVAGAPESGDVATSSTGKTFATQPICDNPTYDATEANWPDPAACAADAKGTQSDIVGTWEGYTEDEYFNPIAKYRLTILAASSGGTICGTVKYGDGAPPPMTDDPTAWYPPVDSSCYPGGTPSDYYGGYVRANAWLLDGATYTIVEGGQLNNQLAVSLSMNDHLRAFCSLQSAYKTTPDASWGPYACMPAADAYQREVDGSVTASIFDPPQTIKFSDAQYVMCDGGYGPGRCACDSCHCTARIEVTHKIELTFSGDVAVGKVAVRFGPSPSSNTLRLKRVAE